ncbi:MAG: hypothetical protein LBD29_07785, partial [Treponema sp.]|nr:hypothetical protein [Treponema sp.]
YNTHKSQRIYSEIENAIIEAKVSFPKNENIFSYISFMNFFQRPAYEKFKEGRFDPNKQDIEKANETLKDVIKYIAPQYIFFVSNKAWENYDKNIFPDNIGNSCYPMTNHWNNYGKKLFKEFIIKNKIFEKTQNGT